MLGPIPQDKQSRPDFTSEHLHPIFIWELETTVPSARHSPTTSLQLVHIRKPRIPATTEQSSHRCVGWRDGSTGKGILMCSPDNVSSNQKRHISVEGENPHSAKLSSGLPMCTVARMHAYATRVHRCTCISSTSQIKRIFLKKKGQPPQQTHCIDGEMEAKRAKGCKRQKGARRHARCLAPENTDGNF